MGNLSLLVLYKLLNNREEALAHWSKLHSSYFSSDTQVLYKAIADFYNKYKAFPSLEELRIFTEKSERISRLVSILLKCEDQDIDMDFLVNHIKDNYARSLVIDGLITFSEKLRNELLTTEDIKEQLSSIVLNLEDKIPNTETVVNVSNMCVFPDNSTSAYDKVPLGINNKFDNETGGIALTEVLYIGGTVNSGKSIIATNIAVNQYLQGNIAVIFSLEMREYEVRNRIYSILSRISHKALSRNELDADSMHRLAKMKCDFFDGADKELLEFDKHRNFYLMEQNLHNNYKPKKSPQIVIIDSPRMTLPEIQNQLDNLKTKYADRFKLPVIDYINQIHTTDKYDWKNQITISTSLKEFARKYEVGIISPYQINKDGDARFAKGILDSADLSMTLSNMGDLFSFKMVKARNSNKFEFASKIDWNSLHISADNIDIRSMEGDSSGEDTPPPKKSRFGQPKKEVGELSW